MLDQDDDDYTTEDLLNELRKSLKEAEDKAQDMATELYRINAIYASLRRRLRESNACPRPK
jgi:hypothetical protein